MKKILIIEDNHKNLRLERDLLEVAGYLVFEARNAGDGIELAMKEIPDLVVMDIRLPDINGIEAAKFLRRQKETAEVPIVFVSASAMPEQAEKIKNIPNAGYITKPIDTRTFAKEIGQYIK